MLASEFNGVRARKWNSERPIIFAPIILRKTTGVYKARDIRTRITRRLNEWEKGNHAALVADTIDEALSNIKSKTIPPEESEVRARVFNSLLLSGRVREAVRYSTNRDQTGILDPEDIDEKTGKPVIQVLKEKHPDIHTPNINNPDCASFEH